MDGKLQGQPFVLSAANRILVLCNILNEFQGCFDWDGHRTDRGHVIYRDFFADKGGDPRARGRALFTDSSDDEKREFKHELTFSHPKRSEDPLFCTWHGKIRAPQMRIHFSWPVRADTGLYVAYVGPKITKR